MPDVNGKGTAVVSRSQMASLMGAEKLRAEKRVLILASGPTAQEAPIAEARAAGSEIWGLNAVHRQVDPFLFTRFFQIHRTGSGEGHIDDPDHAAWLRAWGTPAYAKWVEDWGHISKITSSNGHKEHARIYTTEHNASVPMSVPYPIGDVARLIGPMGRKYFTNTIDFMLALAICEAFTHVDIYGVDMIADEDGEYAKMRQSCEFYVGVMQGRGIKYFIPQRSALCRANRVYGFEEKPKQDDNLIGLISGVSKQIDEEMTNADKRRVEATAELNACKGGKKAIETVIGIIRARERGSQF